MGKKNKTLIVAPTASPEDPRSAEAFALRVSGYDFDRIGEELGVDPWLARELTSIGFVKLATEQADEIRAVSEARLDDLIRRLYEDLKIAGNQVVRNGIYGLILKTEAQRSRLLGLDIPAGTPDAIGDSNA